VTLKEPALNKDKQYDDRHSMDLRISRKGKTILRCLCQSVVDRN